MRRFAVILVAMTALLGFAQPAAAKTGLPTLSDVGVTLYPVAPHVKPAGWKVDAAQAALIARTDPQVLQLHRAHHPLVYQVLIWPGLEFEVDFWFHHKAMIAQVVTPGGRLGPTYTGALIFGIYARGHYGAVWDNPWVWLPMGLMFLLPLAFLRRRSWWDVADVSSVLTFGVSYALFDHLHLEPAVWLIYPPLIYLMVRMLVRGMRPRLSRGRIDCRLPLWFLAAGLLALFAARVWLTLQVHQVMDVGEASITGAYRILHGQSIYYLTPGHGDTYGPIAYLAYVPFQAIWPGDNWASFLPSVRAATITFDLLTIVGLVLVGKRLRRGAAGWKLGLLMAWLWAACPFSAMGLVKNTNDGLVAMALVWLMLSLTTPIRRGAIVGLAAAAKFFPAILLPLVLVGRGGADRRSWRRTLVGFVVAAAGPIALFLPPGGLSFMWQRTLGYQLTRTDIFSAWALHPTLAPLKVAIEAGGVILALLVMFRPRGPRTLAQVSALTCALIIAVQLPALHWFYLYIVWFLPVLLVAVLTAGDESPEAPLPAVERHGAPAVLDPAPALAV